MKKQILCVVLLLGLMAGSAWGLPYVETYENNTPYAGGTGQLMAAGDWVMLGFDFEMEEDTSIPYPFEAHFVDSNFGAEFDLVTDQELNYAHSAWANGWVDFKFWSGDAVTESAWLEIYSANDDVTQSWGEFQIDQLDDLGGGYWGYRAFIGDLDSWSIDAYGDITVEAISGNFLLTSVSVSLEPVPEPGTILLLGAGLLGVVVVRRKAGRFSLPR